MKRALDFFVSLTALIVLSPLLVLIAVAIKLDSRGPVFFRQDRVGLKRKIFKMHKFRTMHLDAEERIKELEAHNEVDGAAFKMTNDPRVTRVGRTLRKLSLDELPQFIDVLNGNMSLVGPRPLPDPRRRAIRPELAETPLQRQARSHLPVAGQRPPRRRFRKLDGARPRVHRQLVAVAGFRHSPEDGPGRFQGNRRELIGMRADQLMRIHSSNRLGRSVRLQFRAVVDAAVSWIPLRPARAVS